MAKRSRDDFELSLPSTDPEQPLAATAPTKPGIATSLTSDTESNTKIQHLDSSKHVEVMRCSLAPHSQTLSFSTFEEYEVHYAKVHVNRCVECRKNFPTPHFLNLHQEENHDPLVAVLRERGDRTYACFVEDCDRRCSTPQKRRMHLIDKHGFPKDYDFFVVDQGIDQRSSMLRSGRHRRKSSAAKQEKARRRSSILSGGANKAVGEVGVNDKEDMDEDEEEKLDAETNASAVSNQKPDADIEDLSGAMSALKFIPASVRFGRGRGRGGFSRS